MTSPNASRLQDALHYMREANKYAERGIFKKPDWDLAAQNYEKAAQAFKAAQSYNEAVSAYVKSSDAMLHSFSHFMAGRALENAAAILELNLGPPEHVADLYRRAGNLYLQDFKPDRAAEMLVKGAKALENASLEKAIKEYMNACNLYESENLERYATDAFKSFIGMLVRNNRLGQAIEILQRLGNIQSKTPNVYSYYKTLLSIVVVQLAIGDEVEAENRFRAFCNT
ncbi:hypothetical protein BGW38_010929 [Lunasporangiospora selenospora]|uniref:Gamma-soluble NSF attachment protein n=1 Tax=Lunasporangiospora selenospora TaxID=979761 RepID=A0A9P6KF68_9FUNG|nr:hypothetical protein BGW38_010929 [Lunasporangiospora selenospora]